METKLAFDAHKIKSVRPLHDGIIVTDMVFEERISTGGIVLVSDDKKSSGIRPRWGQVYAVGPTQKDVQVGEWILVAHGRWSRGVEVEIDDIEGIELEDDDDNEEKVKLSEDEEAELEEDDDIEEYEQKKEEDFTSMNTQLGHIA